MPHGRSLIYRFLLLVTLLPAWVCAEVKLAVVGVPGEARLAVTSLAGEIKAAQLVPVVSEAEVLLLTTASALTQACTHGKPVIFLQSDIVVPTLPSGCSIAMIDVRADFSAQIDLLQKLMPGARRVGVLYSPASEYLLKPLDKKLKQHHLLLVAEQGGSSRHLSAALAALMADVDALLALPDMTVFNRDNARQLLMTAYRQGKPIIGPDDHWVRAGSLASAYISKQSLALSLSDALEMFERTGALPERIKTSPTISVNSHVAHAFGIEIPEQYLGTDVETLP